MKKEIKYLKTLATCQFIEDLGLSIKQFYHIVWSVEKNTESKNPSCKDKKWKNNAFIKIYSAW